MMLFIATFFVFALMAVALALGLLFGREAVRGSCGGLNRIPGLEDACGACTRKRCPRKQGDGSSAAHNDNEGRFSGPARPPAE